MSEKEIKKTPYHFYHELDWYLDKENLPSEKELMECLKEQIEIYNKRVLLVNDEKVPQTIRDLEKEHLPNKLERIGLYQLAINMYWKGYLKGREQQKIGFKAYAEKHPDEYDFEKLYENYKKQCDEYSKTKEGRLFNAIFGEEENWYKNMVKLHGSKKEKTDEIH